MQPRCHLIAVPEPLWSDVPRQSGQRGLLQSLLADTQLAARRIRKRVNVDAERQRHTVVSSHLERVAIELADPLDAFDPEAFAATLARGRLPSIEIGGDYLALLQRLHRAGADGADELLAATLDPERVLDQANAFEAAAREHDFGHADDVVTRLRFLREGAAPASCGVVEAVTFGAGVSVPMPDAMDELDDEPRFRPPARTAHGRTRSARDRLREQVAAALQSGGAINASAQSHEITTEILSEFVAALPGQSAAEVGVTYADGSEGPPFPLRCVPPTSVDASLPVVRVALMSMRHPELDWVVDACWFRNREVLRAGSSGDCDAWCYERSRNRLSALVESFGPAPFTLHMYHTGLEPAVVGFYRAFVDVAQAMPGLCVIPHYFRGSGEYVQGAAWPSGPDSVGRGPNGA